MATRETQVKTTLSVHLTLIRTTIVKDSKRNNKCCRGWGQQWDNRNPSAVLVGMTTSDTTMQIPQKLKTEISFQDNSAFRILLWWAYTISFLIPNKYSPNSLPPNSFVILSFSFLRQRIPGLYRINWVIPVVPQDQFCTSYLANWNWQEVTDWVFIFFPPLNYVITFIRHNWCWFVLTR